MDFHVYSPSFIAFYVKDVTCKKQTVVSGVFIVVGVSTNVTTTKSLTFNTRLHFYYTLVFMGVRALKSALLIKVSVCERANWL